MAQPQTRSLRSKKRATRSSDESSQTGDVQAVSHQKVSQEDTKEADNTQLESSLQDNAAVKKQHNGEEQSGVPKPDESNLENNSGGADATDFQNKGKEESAINETRGEQANYSTVRKETDSEDCSRTLSHPWMFVSAAEDDDKSPGAVLENQVVRETCPNLKSQNTHNKKPGFCVSDIKEAVEGLPARKKRRMGVCGLTGKERSHFLHAQHHDGPQDGTGKHAHDDTTEPLALKKEVCPIYLESTTLNIPAEVVEEEEPKLQLPGSSENQRDKTELHTVVTVSDGSDAASNPEERNREATEGSLADPEINENRETMQPAKEEEEENNLENLLPKDAQEPTAGNETVNPEIQIKTREDLSPKAQTSSPNTSNQEGESDADAARPQIHCVNGATGESKPEASDGMFADGAEDVASSTDTQSEEIKLCEASLTPAVQEMNYSCDSYDDLPAGPSAVHTERTRTSDLEEPPRSGCSDYVSDSQLNTIVLIEEREKDAEPSGCLEDATELICGLIRELSTLNRKVMVAHRELENLRRKPSRKSVH